MNCQISFVIGLGLLGASFATMTVSQDQIKTLSDKLSPELQEKYKSIVEDRKNTYIQGIILGLVVSYFVLRNLNTSNKYYKVMSYVAITMMVCVFYYLIKPKNDYILKYLKSEDENKAWLEVYKTMRSRYMLGMILGALAAIPISNSFC